MIAAALIDAVDDDGYLDLTLDDIRHSLDPRREELTLERIEAVLREVQGSRSSRGRGAQPSGVPHPPARAASRRYRGARRRDRSGDRTPPPARIEALRAAHDGARTRPARTPARRRPDPLPLPPPGRRRPVLRPGVRDPRCPRAQGEPGVAGGAEPGRVSEGAHQLPVREPHPARRRQRGEPHPEEPPAGGAVVHQEPREPRRDAAEDRDLHRRAPAGVSGAWRGKP